MIKFRLTWQQKGGLGKDPDKTISREDYIEDEEYLVAVRAVENAIKILKKDKVLYGYCFGFEVWERKEGVPV